MKVFKVFLVIGTLVVADLVPFRGWSGVVFTSLYSFTGGDDGAFPRNLVKSDDGKLYGVTASGGPDRSLDPGGCGTVFSLALTGEVTTFGYLGGTNGSDPLAIAEGANGCIYGITFAGGIGFDSSHAGGGTVFKVNSDGLITNPILFGGTNGGAPTAFTAGTDGSLYGATWGSAGIGPTSFSTIFRLMTNGITTNLVSFASTNASFDFMVTALLQVTDGDLYGLTGDGGTYLNGSIFKVTPDGLYTTLYSFDGTNGNWPFELIQAADGSFYGSTLNGGIGYQGMYTQSGNGTVFRMAPDGGVTNLILFNGTNGFSPALLTQGPDGNLYGTQSTGGTNGNGSIVKITPDGTLTTLHFFNGYDGSFPMAELVQGEDGIFYGTTYHGGVTNVYPSGYGTVFRISIPMAPVLKTVGATNGTFSLAWSAVSGLTYQVQFNTDLTSTDWNDLGDAIVATNGTMSISDTLATEPQRYYRVVLLP